MQRTAEATLEISKEFTVPADRLFRAWTSEEDLRRWWHPMGNQLKSMSNELQKDGTIEYVFDNTDGQYAFTITGTYKEVEPGKHLSYTWDWQLPTNVVQNSNFLLTVDFEPMENGSRIRVQQEQFADHEAVQPHYEAWDKALNELQVYLQQQ